MAKRVLPNRSKRPSVGTMTDDETSSEEGDEYRREAKRKLQDMLDEDSDIDEEYKPHPKKEENYSDDTDLSEEKETLDQVTTKKEKARPKITRPSRPARSDTGQDSDTSDTSVEDNPPPRKPRQKKPETYQKRPGDIDMNKLGHFPHILCKVLLSKGRFRKGHDMNRLHLLNLLNSFSQQGEDDTALQLFSAFLDRSPVFVCPETHGELYPVYDMISEMAVRLIRAAVGPEVLDEAMKQAYAASASWHPRGGGDGLVARHYMTARITEVLLESGCVSRLCDVMKDCTVVGGKQKGRREGMAVRTARAVTLMMQDLGQVARDDVSVSGVSVGSSLAPDMVVGDLGPIVEACEDGRMDWIAGLYAGFVSERKGLTFGREILEKYRDKNKQCFASHHLLFGFLEKNKETSFLLDCLRNLVNEFSWHSKVYDYCDLLLKENVVDNNDSDEHFYDDIDDSFGESFTKPKESNLNLNKSANYFEVVERLVNLLDYPENEGSLKVWALLADSLRRLYPNEKSNHNIEDLFETRSPWWFDQNFGVDLLETYTDYHLHVIAKKMIVAAYLLGTNCFEFCSGLAVLDDHPNKWKQEVFAYVDAISDPLLDRKAQRQSDFAQEIADEWALIETIKMQSHNS